MKRVVIESPFNPPPPAECAPWTRYGVLVGNIKYARMALLDSLNRDESPFASHLLYPQVYSEDPHFRERGIAAGLAQHASAELVAFYVDLGWSDGMRRACDACKESGRPWEDRRLLQHLTPGADVRRHHLENIPFGDWPLVEQLWNERWFEDGTERRV